MKQIQKIGQDIENIETPFSENALEVVAIPELKAMEIFQERTMSEADFKANMKLAAKLTSYIGGTSENADEYLGQEIQITGAIQHPCTVIDKETGVEKPEMRTVMKRKDGKNLSFVSKAATSFFNNCLRPFFGVGDYPFPVIIKITQSTNGDKRIYNFVVVEN